MKKMQWIVLGVAAATFLCVRAWALDIPGRTSHKVNDYAEVIDPMTEQKLEILLNRLQREGPKGAEVIVSTFPSLDGMSFERFIVDYAHKWRRIWPFENDKRVHFVIIVNDGKMRIGVGYPFENDLPGSKVKELLNDKVTPYFKLRRYSEGIVAGVLGIVGALGGIK